MADPENFSSHTVPSLMKRLWVHGFLVGFALVLVIVLAWVFLRGGSAPSVTAEKETGPPSPAQQVQREPAQAPPAVAAIAPVDEVAPLKSQLARVLTVVRDANLKQDLSQMQSLYSSSFPRLNEKMASISKSWETYEYLKLAFTIDELDSFGPDQAFAQVTWNIETRNRKTNGQENLSKIYLVWFTKDSDQWRIQALENQPPRPQEKPR